MTKNTRLQKVISTLVYCCSGSFYIQKKNTLSSLTRQETMRWLMMTAATAHQRRFSQASKKTTPQNMWSRIMAMVIKAERGKSCYMQEFAAGVYGFKSLLPEDRK